MENKVPILYVMVGLPGSGKSHIAEELARENNAVVYSMDDIIRTNQINIDMPYLHEIISDCDVKKYKKEMR